MVDCSTPTWRSLSRHGRACNNTARTLQTASRGASRACSRRCRSSRGHRHRCPSKSTSPSSPSAPDAEPPGRTSSSSRRRSPRSSKSAGASAMPAPGLVGHSQGRVELHCATQATSSTPATDGRRLKMRAKKTFLLTSSLEYACKWA
jgi:hypothetical protein